MIFAALTLTELAALVPAEEVGITSGKWTLSGDPTDVVVGGPFLVIFRGLCLGAGIGGTDGIEGTDPGGCFGGARPEVILLDPKIEKSKSSGSMFESLLVLSKNALISFLLLNLLPVGPMIKTS